MGGCRASQAAHASAAGEGLSSSSSRSCSLPLTKVARGARASFEACLWPHKAPPPPLPGVPAPPPHRPAPHLHQEDVKRHHRVVAGAGSRHEGVAADLQGVDGTSKRGGAARWLHVHGSMGGWVDDAWCMGWGGEGNRAAGRFRALMHWYGSSEWWGAWIATRQREKAGAGGHWPSGRAAFTKTQQGASGWQRQRVDGRPTGARLQAHPPV